MPTLDTITREDLTLFLNACFACTGQREFYSTAENQRVSVAFLHEYILGNYRRLYARTLAAGVNDFNTAQIVFNLLSSGKHTPAEYRTEENALLTAAFRRLPPQRAWKLVSRLRSERVNNRRTRALLREFVVGHPDLTFHAVKYRRHVRSAAIHARVPLAGELPDFLFDGQVKVFQTPLLEHFRQARYSAEAVYKLPFTVAQGLAAKHRITPEVFLKRIEPQLTERERLRLQQQSGGKVELHPERLPLTALASYVLSLPVPERLERREELQSWLNAAAERVLRRNGGLPLPAGKVAAVLDNSYSATGSREKRSRPLVVAFAVGELLRRAAAPGEFAAFWTHPTADALSVRAQGQTNLTERLLDALDWGAKTVIVVSDGVENDPPNTFHAALLAAKRLRPELTLLHFNPVFDAEMLTVQSLSPHAPAVGLRDADDLSTALGFARFAAGQSELSELEAYLAGRVQAFLKLKEVNDA